MSDVKNALRDASIAEIAAEARERGWRLIPTEFLGAIASGAATGFWPSTKEGKNNDVD